MKLYNLIGITLESLARLNQRVNFQIRIKYLQTNWDGFVSRYDVPPGINSHDFDHLSIYKYPIGDEYPIGGTNIRYELAFIRTDITSPEKMKCYFMVDIEKDDELHEIIQNEIEGFSHGNV